MARFRTELRIFLSAKKGKWLKLPSSGKEVCIVELPLRLIGVDSSALDGEEFTSLTFFVGRYKIFQLTSRYSVSCLGSK